MRFISIVFLLAFSATVHAGDDHDEGAKAVKQAAEPDLLEGFDPRDKEQRKLFEQLKRQIENKKRTDAESKKLEIPYSKYIREQALACRSSYIQQLQRFALLNLEQATRDLAGKKNPTLADLRKICANIERASAVASASTAGIYRPNEPTKENPIIEPGSALYDGAMEFGHGKNGDDVQSLCQRVYAENYEGEAKSLAEALTDEAGKMSRSWMTAFQAGLKENSHKKGK